MKKLLTILIILLLAGHTWGYFVAMADSVSYVLSSEERSETGIEEKKEKECITTSILSFSGITNKPGFNLYSDHPDLLHVKDLIKPPPDQAPVA